MGSIDIYLWAITFIGIIGYGIYTIINMILYFKKINNK